MPTKTKRAKRKPPWKRPRPRGKRTTLSSSERSRARSRAKRAGRRYPNLVDNMNAARAKKRKRTTARKKRAS